MFPEGQARVKVASMKPTKLLNDDGSASMSTMIMLSHHAFRRDAGLFAKALKTFDASRAEALQNEWTFFCGALHGHHEKEDADIFPGMKSANPTLAPIFERLSAQHTKIDPLLERGRAAFAKLPSTLDAVAVVEELLGLLDAHLDEEEAAIIPLLRTAKEFPEPSTAEEGAMYAHGFAWAMQGVSPVVLKQVEAMLPSSVRDGLPAARAAFDERCTRTWGAPSQTSSETSIPNPR